MADAPMIEPNTAAPAAAPPPEITPAAAPPEAAQEESPKGELPDELLKIPAMQALVAGNPAAVSMPMKEFAKQPEAKLLAENKDALLSAGMNFYRSISGETGVIFNQLHVHPEEIQAADKAGKLQLIAPSFNTVNHAVSKSGITNPVLRAQVPPGPKSAPMMAPPQFSSGPLGAPPPAPIGAGVRPAAASVTRKLMQQRTMNLNPRGPTTGSAPGAGRLLNQILQPVV